MIDWNRISQNISFIDGVPALSEMGLIEGSYDAENQIVEGSAHSVDFFRQFHLEAIKLAGIASSSCNILEIGSGFGQIAYGTLKTIRPASYVATDVFPALVRILERNLKLWADDLPTAAALCDPQCQLKIQPGAFNVIQSHSVLHHILDYRGAVKSLFELLDRPGVLIFTEPCLESYLLLQMTFKDFRRNFNLSADLGKQLDLLDEYIDQRSGEYRNSKKYLSQFGTGDKYLFSAHDLFELSADLKCRLQVIRDYRPMRNNFIFELQLRGADDQTVQVFSDYLKGKLAPGMDGAYFCDLRQVFCLIKS